MIKYIYPLAISLFFISCGETPTTNSEDPVQIEVTDYGSTEYGVVEDVEQLEVVYNIYDHVDSLLLTQIEDSIWNSSKVQSLNNEIIAATNGERDLTLLSTEAGDEIFIRLAEDNGSNYVTHVSFYVAPLRDWTIEYYNALDAERVDFQEWNLKD